MTYDEHVDMAMAEPELDDTLESGQDSVAAKDNEITRYEASIIVDTKIEDNARFHLFLAYLWNNAIEPHFTKITKPERQVITNLMNIVRDIIDPEHLVPLVFDN